MSTKTVTAMFDHYDDAAKAVSRLEAAGIPHSEISIVSNDAKHREAHAATTTHDHATAHDATGTGTGTGATLGTVLGGGAGLLAGIGLLAIPGLGPVVAAGWLAATLVGAGAGAATGGIIGALTGAGIDETDAHGYAEGINRGGTLVTVRADESRFATVTDILDDDGTVDMGERESSWKSAGWDGRHTGSGDYAPGTTGALAGAPVIGATPTGATTTTGLGTGLDPIGGVSSPPPASRPAGGRVRSYPL